MDRISRAEVGGPYASHDDAMRAITNKGFDADAADLTVQEGSADDDSDSDDGSSKEATLKQAKFPPPADSGAGATMSPPIESPDKGAMPQQPEPVTDADPMAPGEEQEAEAADSSLPGSEAPGEAVDPLGMGSPMAKTTKPSQMPSGGGGGMPPGLMGGGEDGDDVSGDENPQDPASQQFDEPEQEGKSADPIGGAIASVAAQVMRDNPEVPEVIARRVARKVVGKLILANGLMPHIEDPLANKTPLDVVNDVRKTLPKGSPAAAPSHEDDAEPHGDPTHSFGDHPADLGDDSSLPAAPAAEGAGAEAAGAEGLGAGLGELAPLLLV